MLFQFNKHYRTYIYNAIVPTPFAKSILKDKLPYILKPH